MADITITGLPNASTLSGTERVPMDQAGATVDASAQAIANLATAATVGLGNVSNTSDASKPISTATQAALDAKAAESHTQAASTITGLATVATSGAYTDLSGRPSLAAVASSGVYTDLTSRPTLGTAAPLDVPATGDASATQVVKGSDSRLSDARTPAAHNQAASTITGLAAVATSGSASDLASGTLPAARIPATTVTAGSYGSTSLVPVLTVGADGRITAASTTAVSGGSGTVTTVTGTAPIVSSGGATPDISITAASTSAAGSMSSSDKTKLNGVATGATANATDAQLRDRSTHTGTQAGSTVTGAYTAAGMTMATARLLGRSTASAGAVEEITIGTGLSLSGGTLSASGSSIDYLPTVFTASTITYAAPVDLDMAALAGGYRSISLTGNLELTALNRAAGRQVTLRLVCDASTRTLTFPAAWVFLGTKPSSLAASKTAVLSLSFFGVNNADCVAAYGVQS